ncbi:MAG: EAL domain-containing protein [Gammaproteobacteria bacterium]|nr:EAL domain-containing protein [Gammaproteobacteria bacterium]
MPTGTIQKNTVTDLNQALIMVVEDNPITRKSVRLALQAEGYRVTEAEDGRRALEQMHAQPPDLVLLDLLLPDIHGADLVLQLRALPGGSDIPILAFSGFVSKMEEARVAGAGFTDFLLKPVEPSRLVQTVASFLASRNGADPAPGANRRLLLVDDDPVQLKLLRLQFEHAGFDVHIAHHGAEALLMLQAEPPDLVVSDVLMPHLDGFELCLALRQEPRLRNLPLVMVSANYLEEADQQLGARVGASAFVYREQGFDTLLQAVLESLERPVPVATASVQQLETERHAQIVRQLERQVSLHAACAQRNVVQSAILHELGLIAETLAKRKDLESALDEILAYCLDGAGLSKGALYLTVADAPLTLSAQYGCATILEATRGFFGIPHIFQRALQTGDSLMIPSADVSVTQGEKLLDLAQAKSALIIPVRSGEEDLAVLLLLSLHSDLLENDWLAFGRALASQIGQSVALSRTFYRLAESEQRYRSLFEAANDGICVTDDNGHVLDANPACCALAGHPLEIFRGMDISQVLTGVDRRRWPEMLRDYVRTGVVDGEFSYRMRNGTEKTVEVHGSRVAPGMYLNVIRDITERKRAEVTIQRLAYHDTLTAMPNRVALLARLKQAVEGAAREQQNLALLLINLNNFRDTNDTLGHHNGDQLLIQVAERLRQVLWESDMVARLTGDEFAALLPRLSQQAHLDLVVHKITEALQPAFVIADIPLDVQVAIGVALYPAHGQDTDTLFQHADVALHEAKRNHQSCVVYDAAFDHFQPQQLSLMAELRVAIAQNALALHYQPKVQLNNNQLMGVEALVRWYHPKRGLLPPMEFIPVAEKTGLISDLTCWVIKTALQQAKQWHKMGLEIKIAVNISARNLQDRDFVPQITEILSPTTFTAEQLIFEITESAIMHDPTGAKRKLEELHQRGIRFSIDDFGTGYSSLSYLKELPVSQLKIDKSFVMDFKDPRNAAIVRSTIELAHNLGLEVTAEGVEDAVTLQALTALGCDEAQGYHIGRPMPVADVAAWLERWSAQVSSRA